jgi:hypothetical protein
MGDVITATTTGLPDLIEDGGEVRVLDLTLAEKLGFSEARMIRKLIRRHAASLEGIGSLGRRVTNPGPKGGRPGTAFYLNEAQAHFITAKADTKLADIELARVAQVFTEYRRGNLIAKDAEAQAQLDAIEAKRLERLADWEDDKRVRREVLKSMGRYRPRRKNLGLYGKGAGY